MRKITGFLLKRVYSYAEEYDHIELRARCCMVAMEILLEL